MKTIRLVMSSPYCKTAFFMSVAAMTALLPKSLFHGVMAVPAVVYVLLFSLNITCLIRQTKERTKAAAKNSVLSFLAMVVGVTALNACGLNAPMCGTTIGMSLFSTALPQFLMPLLSDYAIWFFSIAIMLQLYSLWSLKCLTFYSTRSDNVR